MLVVGAPLVSFGAAVPVVGVEAVGDPSLPAPLVAFPGAEVPTPLVAVASAALVPPPGASVDEPAAVLFSAVSFGSEPQLQATTAVSIHAPNAFLHTMRSGCGSGQYRSRDGGLTARASLGVDFWFRTRRGSPMFLSRAIRARLVWFD